MKPPTGTTPERECSLRSRYGRRLLAKSDVAEEVSDTLDLGTRWTSTGMRAMAMYGMGERTSR
jgi:hypothetical protein